MPKYTLTKLKAQKSNSESMVVFGLTCDDKPVKLGLTKDRLGAVVAINTYQSEVKHIYLRLAESDMATIQTIEADVLKYINKHPERILDDDRATVVGADEAPTKYSFVMRSCIEEHSGHQAVKIKWDGNTAMYDHADVTKSKKFTPVVKQLLGGSLVATVVWVNSERRELAVSFKFRSVVRCGTDADLEVVDDGDHELLEGLALESAKPAKSTKAKTKKRRHSDSDDSDSDQASTKKRRRTDSE